MWMLVPVLAWSSEPFEHTFPESEKTLDLRADKATVSITTGGSAITIRGSHEGDPSMCHLRTDHQQGATAIYEAYGSSSLPRECIARMEISVPVGSGVHVALEKGTLDVQLDGTLQGQLNTGDIKGQVTGAVHLDVGQGNVILGGLTEPTEVKVGAGNAALVFEKAPQGDVLLTMGRGGVFIDLPDETIVDARVPSGVKVPLVQKTTAPTKLMVRNAMGEVVIE